MQARARMALMGVATLVLLAAVAVVLLVDAGPGSRASSDGFAGSLRPEIPPKDFRLRDEWGRAVSLSDYRGRVVILTFLCATCRQTCPVIASQIRGALDDLDGEVPSLAVSVDPAGDTPRNARRFLRRRGLTGRMRFLLGSRRQLRPVWRDYAIQPQGDGSEHSAYVLLVDRSGRQRLSFPFDKLTPEGLAHDVRLLREEAPS